MKHCCKEMTFFLEENKVAVNYSVKDREYSINLKNSHAIQLIKYCPWCGAKLPKELSDEWFKILEKEYGIECPLSNEEKHKIPKEFKTDEWWKKRGL